MSSAEWRPFCLGLNVLSNTDSQQSCKAYYIDIHYIVHATRDDKARSWHTRGPFY